MKICQDKWTIWMNFICNKKWPKKYPQTAETKDCLMNFKKINQDPCQPNNQATNQEITYK